MNRHRLDVFFQLGPWDSQLHILLRQRPAGFEQAEVMSDKCIDSAEHQGGIITFAYHLQ
jgi:hypothetical protein